VRLLALGLALFALYALVANGDGRASRAAQVLADGGGLERAAHVAVPDGIGLPLLLAPAREAGGRRAAELVIAAVAAAAFVLGALLGRRLAPEPWATGAAAVVGAWGVVVAGAGAALLAAALVAAATLCALAVREHPRALSALAGAAALAALPWLGPLYVLAGLPVAWMLVRWAARGPRRIVALLAAELILGSLVVCATLGERLYGGPLPDLPSPDLAVEELLWAPLIALGLAAACLLWRSRREHIARALPARAAAEAAAALLLAVAAFALPALTAALPAFAALSAWSLRAAGSRTPHFRRSS